nr:hypothetical protein [Enterococcus sp. 665A]MBO1340301.1 hypothetical protein [Enterococcus sp. 665A]
MEQVIEGWVTINQEYWVDEDEIYLLKKDQGDIDGSDEGRQLRVLMGQALNKLGLKDAKNSYEKEQGISGKYVADNVMMQLFASSKRVKLDEIKEKIVLNSMGLLNFRETEYVHSTWTIGGYISETFTLGGHNILEILKQHEGQFIYLVIDAVH